MRARVLGTAVAMAAALGPLAGSAAAGAWGTPMELGLVRDVGDFSGPSSAVALAMDATGTAVVAWSDDQGVLSVARDPGAAQFTAGPPQRFGFGRVTKPGAALDGTGRALVVWVAGGAVQGLERAPGGPFASLPALASGASDGADVAFLADGTALVAYAGADGAVHIAQRPRGGAFAVSALPATPGASVSRARIVAAGGYALVTWTETTSSGSTTTSRAMASVLIPGAGFDAPRALVTTTSDTAATALTAGVRWIEAAINPAGAADVVVAWSVGGPTSNVAFVDCVDDAIATRTAGPAGTWASPVADGGSACQPNLAPQAAVAEGDQGDALLLLGRSQSPGGIVVASRWRAAGSPTYGPGPDVFADPSASPTAAWTGLAALSGGRYLAAFLRGPNVLATVGTPAGGFGAPVTVGADPSTFTLEGMASNGTEAVVAWAYSRSAAHLPELRAALYDDRASTPVAPIALSGLTLTRRRFARPITIRWQVSVPATMTFGVARLRGKRAVKVGSFARPAHPGLNQLRFAGVLHGHRLHPGRYRLTAVATAPGMAPSPPASVTFVVRRLSRGRG
ncbi:MAG: hypothetical protein QOI62_1389 [Solirubrobacteraceae bacterium]|jgi:hypothetical protein|nr:hypothetical protein [Solirubrobacteraceae bacterium]